MKNLRRLILGGLGAAVTTVLTVVALPGVAHAAALPTETVQYGSNTTLAPPATSTWDFTTTSSYWSVVGVYSGSDYDLDLSGSGTYLSSSTYSAGITDFIAIDSNSGRRPFGDYQATVRRFAGTQNFAVEQKQGRSVITLPIPANDGVSGPSDPDIAFAAVNSKYVVNIEDIYLTAGQSFWVNTQNPDDAFFLLESDPSSPSTWVRTRNDAVRSTNYRAVDGCTIYTARFTGWHAIVMASGVPVVTTPPGGGTAYALIRYSPSRPTSCPIKNFPSPTP